MKFNYMATVALVLAAANTATAFTPVSPSIVTSTSTIQQRSNSQILQRNMSNSSADDEVAKLMEAAAQARADAARLAKELGKDIDDDDKSSASAAKKAAPTKSNEEVKDSIMAINFNDSDAVTQTMKMDALKEGGYLTLFKSATEQAGSGDLKDFPVSISMLESRTGLTSKSLGVGVEEVSLDDFKYATLYVLGGCSVGGVAALAFLPENIGPTICYLLAVIPILFLGIGSTAPGFIAEAIAGVKGNDDDSGVTKAERVARHEAAHFLCGYLCGLPIAGYSTTDENVPCIEFHTTRAGPLTAKQEYTEEEVNALTVVAMSGSVAEAMAFGTAKGSTSDLIDLESNVFRQSKNFLGAAKQQDLTRWGALTSQRLLTLHKEKLDCLVDAFTEQKSVAECVALLEQK